MQVASWLPRVELPFAAPARAQLLAPIEAETATPQAPVAPSAAAIAAAAPIAAVAPAVPAPAADERRERPRVDVPRPGSAAMVRETAPAPVESTVAAPERPQPPPRFALQLLRAGDCALLVELPTGESFQSRDPAYLLLKDLLRAAGLPDSPQQVGDGSPIRWPLLSRGNLDQGPQAACDYVQGVLAGQLESQPSACLWLIGLPAIRFAGEGDAESYNRELTIEGLGPAWALPGLELLMDEPERKRELWQAMRRVMQRWKPAV
ncbi:MAG TPA: energy transducer TonB [Pseudomonas sp.]|nr:energy transducer TonB [Pseudomonas sp.]